MNEFSGSSLVDPLNSFIFNTRIVDNGNHTMKRLDSSKVETADPLLASEI